MWFRCPDPPPVVTILKSFYAREILFALAISLGINHSSCKV
jgi:hypothetical protein